MNTPVLDAANVDVLPAQEIAFEGIATPEVTTNIAEAMTTTQANTSFTLGEAMPLGPNPSAELGLASGEQVIAGVSNTASSIGNAVNGTTITITGSQLAFWGAVVGLGIVGFYAAKNLVGGRKK